MFELFRFLIRPDMKPERIELEGGGTVFFLSIVIGSFEDALQVLALAAWAVAKAAACWRCWGMMSGMVLSPFVFGSKRPPAMWPA